MCTFLIMLRKSVRFRKTMHPLFYLSFSLISTSLVNSGDVFIHMCSHGELSDAKYFCITNSTSGMIWINKLKPTKTESEFFPRHNAKNSYNFSLPNNTRLSSVGVILDRRWEGLNIFKTYPQQHPLRKNLNSFTKEGIAFSVLIEKDAHVYLCDGNNTTISNCYWFLLQSSNKTVLQKCKPNELPSDNNNRGCEKLLQKIEHSPLSLYLSEKQWVHLTITKCNTRLVLRRVAEDAEDVLLDVQDPEPLKISFAFFHGKTVEGLWKFHESRSEIAIDKPLKNVILGPPVAPTNGSVCLSFFALAPSDCDIKLSAKQRNKEIKEVSYPAEHVTSCTLRRWKEIRFVTVATNSSNIEFYISTSCKRPSSVVMLDKPRLCRNNELRAITANENNTCQFISKKTILSSEEEGICPENTFSRHCISCFWFAPHPEICDKIKFVEKDTSRHGCLPGYTGDTCDKICPKGFYGHFCHQKCGHCLDGLCHHINGNCSCVDDFKGDKCNIAPPIMFFHAPNVTMVKFTEAIISVNNFTVINKFDDNPQRYKLQYRKIELNETWKETNEFYPFGKKNEIKINNLNPDSEYLARFVIETKSGKLYLDELHFSTFTTLCLVKNLEVINVTPSTKSAKISISLPCNKSQNSYWIKQCLLHNLDPKISRSKTVSIHNSTNLELTNLEPFSNYSLEIILCYNVETCFNVSSVKFRTNAPASGPVQDLSVYSNNETSISLKWKQPFPFIGNLEYYQITWNNYTKTINGSPCELWSEYHCFTISNLKRAQWYKISVTTKTVGVDKLGSSSTIHFRTIIGPSNAPSNMTVFWTPEDDLKVCWSNPTTPNGTITLFNITFSQKNNTYAHIFMAVLTATYNIKPSYNYTISNKFITPSSDFNITVAAYNGFNGTDAAVSGVTPPSRPKLKQEPKIFNTEKGITVQISNKVEEPESNVLKKKLFILLWSNYQLELSSFDTNSPNLINVDIAYVCNISGTDFNVTIGGNPKNCTKILKSPLLSNRCYNVTIVVVNTFRDKSRYSSYPWKDCVQIEWSKIQNVWIYFICIAAVVIIIFAFFFGIKKWMQKRRQTSIFRENLCNPILNDYIGINDINVVPIKVNKFPEYVKTSLKNGELIRQHKKYFNTETSYERLQEHNLIMDFISIRFRDQYFENAYLMTKMPKFYEKTIFWKNVWNKNVTNIIVFDISKKESIKDWNEPLEDISLQLIFQANFADYEERRFILCNKGKKREIRHLRYMSTLYSLSLLPFFVKTSEISFNSKSPILVQSSSKIQHTAFAIMCDLALRMSKWYQEVDFVRICKQLLEFEVTYVNEADLYLLAHLVVVESLQNSNAKIISPSMCVFPPEMKKYSHYLKETIWIDKIEKNRNSLQTYTEPKEGHLFTTNTVKGFQSKNFWVMEQPSKACVFQFWDIVVRKKISVIIALSDNFSTTACWSQVQPSETIIFKHLDTKKFSFYDWNTTQIVINNEEFVVDLFLVKNWQPTCDCPDSIRDFVSFCIETQKVLRKTESVLVTCCNGVTASSLYLAMIYNIEKMINEGVCDVCTAVRVLRRYNQHFVQSEAQHTFLWEAAKTYLKETQFYETR